MIDFYILTTNEEIELVRAVNKNENENEPS